LVEISFISLFLNCQYYSKVKINNNFNNEDVKLFLGKSFDFSTNKFELPILEMRIYSHLGVFVFYRDWIFTRINSSFRGVGYE